MWIVITVTCYIDFEYMKVHITHILKGIHGSALYAIWIHFSTIPLKEY